MSQRTVPVLLASITALFLVLVIIIAMMLATPERRLAGSQRSQALATLLSKRISGDEPPTGNLAWIAGFIASPTAPGGSLDNLFHFISKDPGRSDFPRASDRRRADAYLAEGTPSGRSIPGGNDVPRWVPSYIRSVDILFEGLKRDIFRITGFPDELTPLENSEGPSPSSIAMTEQAIGRFADVWIPSGETTSSYRTDRSRVRTWLIGNRRFLRRLAAIDQSWSSLIAGLYNLSVDERWRTAVAYVPELNQELDEIIIMVLSADIHRRSRDLMVLVDDPAKEPGSVPGPGILWMPEFSYYKNIPELTGYTSDADATIFFAKVNLGYTFRDSRTQTWLNRRKDWLSDYFMSFFSQTVTADFSPVGVQDRQLSAWESSRLKAEGIHGINDRIVASLPFGVKGVYGVRDMALVRVNLLANP